MSLLFTVINHPNKKQIAAAGVAQICKEEDLRSHGTNKIKYYIFAVLFVVVNIYLKRLKSKPVNTLTGH